MALEYIQVKYRESICPCCDRRQKAYLDQDGEWRLLPHYIGRSSTQCLGNHEIALQVQTHSIVLVKKVS